jgi:hypothetical protein
VYRPFAQHFDPSEQHIAFLEHSLDQIDLHLKASAAVTHGLCPAKTVTPHEI